MRKLLIVSMLTLLTACGTMGGAVSGMGEDLTKAGQWIRSK
jgi:predicted small secreted protein